MKAWVPVRALLRCSGALFVSFFLSAASWAGGVIDTPGEFAVSPTGAATYTIPLKVPPGVGGMEPKLALVYNSQGGDGILGKGWSLSGLSAITRCPQTVAQDGAKGWVNFDANDRFCLDGQRLIAVSGAYGGDGTEYRTEIDGFSRVISHGVAGNGPAWFEVHTKSGLIMEYGNTTDSRILAANNSDVAKQTTARVWALDKITDTVGNYLVVAYVVDAPNGNYYPISIVYTGNSIKNTAPTNSIQFAYVARQNAPPLYQAGSLIRNTVQLVSIWEYVQMPNYGPFPVRHYDGFGNPTDGSKTSMGIEYGEGLTPSSLQPTTFTWQQAANNGTYTQKVASVPSNNWDANRVWAGDYNGDGKTDVLSYYAGNLVTFLSNGDGTYTQKVTAVPSNNWDANRVWAGDYNGDGKTDILSYYAGNLVFFFSNGDGTSLLSKTAEMS